MFRYEKEILFKEFEVAKERDIAMSKKPTSDERETEFYKNRIQFFKDHIELKKNHPEYYENVDIKFDKLLALYETPNPRDAFYRAFFGMSYAEKRAESEPKSVRDY